MQESMSRYYIWTIGCQMNEAESERLASALSRLGYEEATSAETADLVFLNSCVVRASAENKVVNKLSALRALKKRNPGVVITLTGCLVDDNTDDLKQRFSHVDCFLKPGEYPGWLNKVSKEESLPERPSVSSYVPIIYGCNNFCAYCIVPYRRGRERSRPLEEIICEVRELVRRGTREVILLGQNVDEYGSDLEKKPDLAELLTELNEVDGLLRIRFLTNHPKYMSLRLIETMTRLDKVCQQLSLPIQSGSDRILRAMGRGYTAQDYRRLVGTIRGYMPDIALSTDVIVGFPGETQADFDETVRILADIRFDQVHIAAYSPRAETLAAREMTDDVPPEEKKVRLSQIEMLQEGIATEINARLMGKTAQVLVQAKKGALFYGRTESDKLVFFTGETDSIGHLINIRITRTSPWSLSGLVVSES